MKQLARTKAPSPDAPPALSPDGRSQTRAAPVDQGDLIDKRDLIDRGDMINGVDIALLQSHRDLKIAANADLRALSRWRIGGRCDLLIEPASREALAYALHHLSQAGVTPVIIGDGSNLLFDDEGVRGVIIKIGKELSRVSLKGVSAKAEAGIWTPFFARRIGNKGLTGIEHTVGIPGTLGGLVVMNGGSLRKGIGDNITAVTCLDFQGKEFLLSHEECQFSYRSSSLQKRELIVVEAEFIFAQKAPALIRREMIEIMASRRKKFPLRLPNCGSVFLSNPAMYEEYGPPGKLIEEAGLRGMTLGDAQIAHNHGNFIVNLGDASSRDVLRLIAHIRKTVHKRTGYEMDCEVKYVSPLGAMVPAHIKALTLYG